MTSHIYINRFDESKFKKKTYYQCKIIVTDLLSVFSIYINQNNFIGFSPILFFQNFAYCLL